MRAWDDVSEMLLLSISLPADADRRRHLAGQLGRYGLSAEWIPAVDARDLPADTSRDSPLSAGQRACWLSHRKAWAHARELGADHVCIVEDDLCWLADPRAYLADCFLPDQGLDLVQLGSISYRFPERSAWMTAQKQASLTARWARRVHPRFAHIDADIRAGLIRQSARRLQSYLDHGGSIGLVRNEFGAGTHSYVISIAGIDALEAALRSTPPDRPIDGYLSQVAAEGRIPAARLNPGVSSQYPFASRIR